MLSERRMIRWRSLLALGLVAAVGLAGAALARDGRLISVFWLLNLAMPFLALGGGAALREDWGWAAPAPLVAAARVAAAGLAFAGALLFFGAVLAWGDPTPRTLALSLGIGALYLLPSAITPFLGGRPGWMARRTLLLLLIAWLAAYGWLRAESALLLADAAAEGRAAHVQRHWPFAGSSVSYSPQDGVHWHD